VELMVEDQEMMRQQRSRRREKITEKRQQQQQQQQQLLLPQGRYQPWLNDDSNDDDNDNDQAEKEEAEEEEEETKQIRGKLQFDFMNEQLCHLVRSRGRMAAHLPVAALQGAVRQKLDLLQSAAAGPPSSLAQLGKHAQLVQLHTAEVAAEQRRLRALAEHVATRLVASHAAGPKLDVRADIAEGLADVVFNQLLVRDAVLELKRVEACKAAAAARLLSAAARR
jgi:hypothetical protein